MGELLPPEKLPASWSDEARLNVLFAPFRNRSVNSKDWESKMHFWKNLIFEYCSHHKKYSFTLPALIKIFTKNGRPPACLDIVINDMFKDGEIKPINVFLEKPAETWSLWAVDIFIKKPVVWSFRKLKDVITPPDSNITYVHLNALERNASEICNKIPEDQKCKVIDLKELTKTLNIGNDEHFRYLLHYLSCQGKVCLKDINSGKDIITLVKFCEPKSKIISDSDVDIYTLELTEKTLVNTIDKLEEDSAKLVKETKNYLLMGRKQLAKTYLRKKHEIDRTIEKRANTLHNVQVLVSRLKDADSDEQILTSYKKALASLRHTFNETGLNEDAVTNTMIDLEEVMDIQKDVQEAMVLQTDVANDRELEEELEELLGEDQKTEEEDLSDLEQRLKNLDIASPSKEKLQSVKNREGSHEDSASFGDLSGLMN